MRAIGEIKQILGEMRAEQKAQRHEMVPRELWEEWKGQIATDVVNLEAEQARIRKEFREELRQHREDMSTTARWAIGLAVTAFSVAIAGIGLIVNALGLGA